MSSTRVSVQAPVRPSTLDTLLDTYADSGETDDIVQQLLDERHGRDSAYSPVQKFLFAVCSVLGLVAIGVIIYEVFYFGASVTPHPDLYNHRPAHRVVFDTATTCNDGTEPVYFFRQGQKDDTDKWVFRLAGDGMCVNQTDCDERFVDFPKTMTTLIYDSVILDEEGGILSDNPGENPEFSDYNVVELHYCSSDGFLGTSDNTANCSFRFEGAQMVLDMLLDLQANYDMDEATVIVGVGAGIGGSGIMQHLDDIDDALPAEAVKYYVSDAGIELEDFPSPTFSKERAKQAYDLHKPALNDDCLEERSWKCYYTGTYLLDSLLDDFADVLLVAEQTFDRVDLNIEDDVPLEEWTHEQWVYAVDRAAAIVSALNTWEGSFFNSDCTTHVLTDKSAFALLEIEDDDDESWSLSTVVDYQVFDEKSEIMKLRNTAVIPDNNPTCSAVYDH